MTKSPSQAPSLSVPICFFSKQILTTDMLVLRIVPEGEQCQFSLTLKKNKEAIYVHLTMPHIQKLKAFRPQDLGDSFHAATSDSLENIEHVLMALLEKKLHAALGFALKIKKAIIGQKAIERKLVQRPDMIAGLLITKQASGEIAQKLIDLGNKSLKVLRQFPDEWLTKITQKEKSCYLAFTNDKMNMGFYQEYTLYATLERAIGK